MALAMLVAKHLTGSNPTFSEVLLPAILPLCTGYMYIPTTQSANSITITGGLHLDLCSNFTYLKIKGLPVHV